MVSANIGWAIRGTWACRPSCRWRREGRRPRTEEEERRSESCRTIHLDNSKMVLNSRFCNHKQQHLTTLHLKFEISF